MTFTITPWEVKGEIDYNRITKQFGTSVITDHVLERIKRHTKDLHFMLRRKIFFSHRDLGWIIDEYEKRNKFFMYTGRGPSGHTHLGHLLPWMFTKWLQDKFNTDLYFQITDDEKFYFKPDLKLEEATKWGYENILDIIALGFKPKKTHIFLDTEYAKTLYNIAARFAKKLTFSTAKAVFGFTNETNVGSIFYTSMQSAPCYIPNFTKGENRPCLIPLALDQDPHFRVTRDIAHRLGLLKPGIIHCMFLPSLLGPKAKMSASSEQDTIYTIDGPETVANKIRKYAFSGGQSSIKEHREKGGNPDMDISYQYLRMLLEPNDKKLQKIHDEYESGKLLTSELKEITIEKCNAFLKEHQRNREKARKKVDKFMLRD